MGIVNKYGGKCVACATWVGEGAGEAFSEVEDDGTRRWRVRCLACAPDGGVGVVGADAARAPRPGQGAPVARLWCVDGGDVACRPASFLGDVAFAAFKVAMDKGGAKFVAQLGRCARCDAWCDGVAPFTAGVPTGAAPCPTCGGELEDARPSNRAPMAAVPGLVAALRDASIVVEVAPDLAARLQAQADAARTMAAQADARMGTIVADLAARGDTLWRFQQHGILFLAERMGALLADEQGLGKLQPVDAQVITPKGWRAIGSLTPGDRVIGSNGQATRVTGVFPQGVRPSFRVTLSDGASVEAGAEHLWAVEYLKGGRTWTRLTLTTDQLRLRPMFGTLDLAKTNLRVPMLSAPVEFARKIRDRLPIAPYALGALIANGSLAHGTPQLVFGVRDWEDVRPKLRLELSAPRRYGNTVHVCALGLIDAVRYLCLAVLSRYKRIPPLYLRAAPAERLLLLQGLMDADGHVTPIGNKVMYSTMSPGLAKDVVELVEGLGGLASVRSYDRTWEGKGVEFSVRIRCPAWVTPFTVAFKAGRYRPSSRSRPCRYVKTIEYVRDVESVCIAVDAPDRLYATEHCILTHNTVQALLAVPKGARALVVAPAVVRGNWAKETRRWRPDLRVVTLEGRGALDVWPAPHELVVLSWESLSDDAPKACPSDLVLIGDEVHRVKAGPKKTRTAAKWHLVQAAVRAAGGRVWGLSGTPVENLDMEMWHVLEACGGLGVEAFGKKTTFRKLQQGDSATYARAAKTVVLRRLKSEVLKDLPPKVREVHRATIDAETRRQLDAILQRIVAAACERRVAEARKAWHEASAATARAIEEDGPDLWRSTLVDGLPFDEAAVRAVALADVKESIELAFDGKLPIPFECISQVKSILATAKVQTSQAILDEWEDVDAGTTKDEVGQRLYANPILFFSAHVHPVHAVAARPGWAKILGETPPGERTKLVAEFQAGRYAGLAITIRAGGVGITLTRSSRELFNDLEWTPSKNVQAEDRAHRIGQDATSVQIARVVADHVLDERILEILDAKERIIAQVVETAARGADERPESAASHVEATLAAVQVASTNGTGATTIALRAERGDDEAAAATWADANEREGMADEFLRSVVAQWRRGHRRLTERQWGALVARHRRWGEAKAANVVRAPADDVERWTSEALATLAGVCDGAVRRDDVGFNAHDAATGHGLATRASIAGLTDGEWRFAARLLRKYHRQVGVAPGATGGGA